LAVLFVAAWSMAATPEQIETAIQRTKEYIYSQQQPDGTWENKPRDPTDKGNMHEGGQRGGRTALAVYSLLAAGECPQDPRLKRAIDFLRTEQMVGVYAVGLRSQVWYFLPPTNEVKSLMVRDARFLIRHFPFDLARLRRRAVFRHCTALPPLRLPRFRGIFGLPGRRRTLALGSKVAFRARFSCWAHGIPLEYHDADHFEGIVESW